MLLLVNQIFNSTNRAVSQGVELSEVISNERAVNTLIHNDVAEMVGPETGPADGAPLIIVQHRVLNQDPDFSVANGFPLASPPAGPLVRADQLVFARRITGELPISPSSSNAYTPSTGDPSIPVPYARVWYGHLLRADSGSTPEAGDDPGAGVDFDDTTGALDDLDLRPNSWLLGRQALFLLQNPSSGSFNPGVIRSEGAWLNAIIAGGYATAGGTGPDWPSTPTSNLPLYMGLTDVAAASLHQTTEPASTTPDIRGSIVSEDTGLSNTPGIVLGANLNATDYRTRAVENFTFAQRRLRTMDRPPLVATRPLSDYYKRWEIAQSHPILAEGTSDFIVEFAADADLDGEVDRVLSGELPNSPINYDAAFVESVKWYTHDAYVNRPSGGSLGATPGAAYDAERPLTFELPNTPFRTAVYENSISLNASTAAFVFRHDSTDPGVMEVSTSTGARTFVPPPPTSNPCYWPYLLRVRYRMHDPRGDLGTEQDTNGVWFEKILRVNRPYPLETPVP